MQNSAKKLADISVETMAGNLAPIVAGSSEQRHAQTAMAKPAGQPAAGLPAAGTSALDQYTINLTQRARAGQIDPVIARDEEIRQMADILIRRR